MMAALSLDCTGHVDSGSATVMEEVGAGHYINPDVSKGLKSTVEFWRLNPENISMGVHAKVLKCCQPKERESHFRKDL
jgi:hypothetical protein